MIEKLLDRLMGDLELDKGDIGREKDKSRTIMLSANITLTFKDIDNDYIEIFSELTACPELNLEELYSKLMTGNLFGEQTGGAVIGLNTSATNFVLRQEFPNSINYNEFYGHVEDFLNNVEYWQSVIDTHAKQSDKRAPGLF